MERNENQLLMHSIRDPIPLDSSKLEILADSSRINDITSET